MVESILGLRKGNKLEELLHPHDRIFNLPLEVLRDWCRHGNVTAFTRLFIRIGRRRDALSVADDLS